MAYTVARQVALLTAYLSALDAIVLHVAGYLGGVGMVPTPSDAVSNTASDAASDATLASSPTSAPLDSGVSASASSVGRPKAARLKGNEGLKGNKSVAHAVLLVAIRQPDVQPADQQPGSVSPHAGERARKAAADATHGATMSGYGTRTLSRQGLVAAPAHVDLGCCGACAAGRGRGAVPRAAGIGAGQHGPPVAAAASAAAAAAAATASAAEAKLPLLGQRALGLQAARLAALVQHRPVIAAMGGPGGDDPVQLTVISWCHAEKQKLVHARAVIAAACEGHGTAVDMSAPAEQRGEQARAFAQSCWDQLEIHVSKPMCDDCRSFFCGVCRFDRVRVRVADPHATHEFDPQGTESVIHR
jgi:hypothetical protein